MIEVSQHRGVYTRAVHMISVHMDERCPHARGVHMLEVSIS